MGMFDYVAYDDTCFCGEKLEGFQTKDGPKTLDTVNPGEIRNFYTSCTKCFKWYNYEVIVKDYEIKREEETQNYN